MCNSDENKARLLADREALLSQLDQIDSEIARLGTSCGRGSSIQNSDQKNGVNDYHSTTANAEQEPFISGEELLEIEAKKHQEIGLNLHDAFQQHLVGILWLLKELADKLESEDSPCVSDALKIIDIVKQTVELTRNLAQGLRPVDLIEQGLDSALDQLASTTSKLFRVACDFKCDMKKTIENSATAEHLYRIVQEAITNAIKHSRAKHIVVTLSSKGHNGTLTVEYDGQGFSDDYNTRQGMGLRIMAYRAKIIGGTLDIETVEREKVIVICSFSLGEN